jgi:hypothetical protein
LSNITAAGAGASEADYACAVVAPALLLHASHAGALLARAQVL